MATEASNWTGQFRRDGYAHFPQLLSRAVVETARQAILQDVGEHFDASRLVEYNNQSWCPGLRNSPAIKNLFKNKAVQAITNEALGKGRYGWDRGQIAIRKAHSAEKPYEPTAHIDGIPTPTNGMQGTEIQNFTALIGIFLTEVKSDFAGNFTVWPGSHLILEQYFRERGKTALGHGMPNVPIGDPLQLRMLPGDVVLCHYQLAHTAAVNTSDDDRIATFFRLWFNDISGPEKADQRWHHLTNIWHGWQI